MKCLNLEFAEILGKINKWSSHLQIITQELLLGYNSTRKKHSVTKVVTESQRIPQCNFPWRLKILLIRLLGRINGESVHLDEILSSVGGNKYLSDFRKVTDPLLGSRSFIIKIGIINTHCCDLTLIRRMKVWMTKGLENFKFPFIFLIKMTTTITIMFSIVKFDWVRNMPGTALFYRN